jgi:Protein of unknown function (DUF1488)
MPLERMHDEAIDPQLEGVYFGMVDGTKTVRCLVLYEALMDRGKLSDDQDGRLQTFHQNREEIERIASEKYDAGLV